MTYHRIRSTCEIGIRARVVIPLIGICLLLASVGGWLIQRSHDRYSRDHLQARAAAIAHGICHLAETTPNKVELQRFVAAMSAERDVKLILVATGDPLSIVASSRVDWLGMPASELPDQEHTAKDLYRAVTSNERHVEFEHDQENSVDFTVPLRTRIHAANSLTWSKGAVMLHLDGRPHMRQQATSTTRLLAALFATIAIAAGCAYGLLSYIVLRPSKQIAMVTRQVAEGDRAVRVQSRQTDELGQLASDVDAMLDELVRREKVEAEAKEEAIFCQRQMESALAELACSNVALDEHSILAITDLRGVITSVNDKFCEISKYTRDELIGSTHRIVNSGYHPTSFWKQMWRTVYKGEPWHGEVCNRSKDGALYWVDTTIVPYKDQDGRITKFVAIRSDITERKLFEEKLRESQERFELAVRGSNDGIWDWEVATGSVYYSARFREHLGYSEEEFPNQLDSFLDHLHPDDLDATWEAVQKHLAEDEPYDVTYRLRTKHGDWRWFRAKGIAIRDSHGRAYRMAGSISDISEIKKIEEQLAKDATHDRLTGLPNRVLLEDRLQQALQAMKCESSCRFALLFLDFDRFKLINDSLGHDAGDELLRQIAERLNDNTGARRSSDAASMNSTNARLGGDEFVVLLENFGDSAEVFDVASRLLSALAEPYHLADQDVKSTASMGVVIGSPDYEKVEHVVRDADMAMYEAKRSGKGTYVVFDEYLQLRMQRRLQLEEDLKLAIKTDQLHFEYEPIIELQSGSVQSVEAHLCWQHPVHGTITTSEINRIAEESGVAFHLANWILGAACGQLQQWQQDFKVVPKALNLNLTPKQFALPNLPRMVLAKLRQFNVSPSNLRFEITEAAFSTNMTEAAHQVARLRKAGVSVAIDHFGVGTSSFTSLHRLPVDLVKIDRSMMTNLQDSKQAASLIHGLAVIVRNLGISLVAVGIEKTDELIALQGLGCDLAQGAYFGPKMSADSMAQFIQTATCSSYEVKGASLFAMRWAESMDGQEIVDNVVWSVNSADA